MHESHDQRAFLTAEDVQDLLGLDRSTVYRMAADGRLPAVKIGRSWRFPSARIHELLSRPTLEPLVGVDSAGSAVVPTGTTQAVLDVAAEMLGVMMLVTDMQGLPITDVAHPNPWFVEHRDDPEVFAECLEEWRERASDPELEARFAVGAHGFECAHTFIRAGTSLVGMVLAGGVRPEESDMPGLYDLDDQERARVLEMLPKIARTLSRAATNHTNGNGALSGAGLESLRR